MNVDFFSEIYLKILSLFHFFDLEKILNLLSIVPFVFLIELLFVGWSNSSLKKILKPNKTVQTDLFYFSLILFNFYSLLVVLFSFGFFHLLNKGIKTYIGFNLIHTIENTYLQFIILFIIYDLVKYINHFIFHKSKTLWNIHKFHHSATDFSIFTRYRFNPLEGAITSFVKVLPFVILGGIETYVVVRIFSEVLSLMHHSALKSNWGLIGKYILVSPATHRLHHSKDPKHFDKNFGVVFIFWDRLFNTYSDENTKELGIPNNEFNKRGVVKDLFYVVVSFYNAVFLKIKKVFR
ncbi:sterol desaturase family protein [Polaribacter aquimarinus]|uniref:Fatty acid hydroxylase domain-containing protein n=1 Tax=Polaribacter aquimarinus TaxID=2100726 RepID=A0A2U2JC64_9FLAO|nr:sterol desaturase family protein [Polaribacter aquimarinus]PWG05929.1 hypothetical protein DIS07_05675 [Polaribacter aquimarinus]